MDEPTKKAFDFAADVTKQLITVASAIVTVTVTFSKDTPVPARDWAYGAWSCFLVSILLGFGALMCMTGELQPKVNNGVGKQNPSVWKGNITFFSATQIFVFLVGICLTAWFGRIAMQSSAKPQRETQPQQVCNCVFPTPKTVQESPPRQPVPKIKKKPKSISH
jgi:hypothetical protein